MINQILLAGMLATSSVSYTIPEINFPMSCTKTFYILQKDMEILRAWKRYSPSVNFETHILFNAMMNGVCLKVTDKVPSKKWKLNRIIG